jgi:hypothetical protein
VSAHGVEPLAALNHAYEECLLEVVAVVRPELRAPHVLADFASDHGARVGADLTVGIGEIQRVAPRRRGAEDAGNDRQHSGRRVGEVDARNTRSVLPTIASAARPAESRVRSETRQRKSRAKPR